jgi:hypothetical protein
MSIKDIRSAIVERIRTGESTADLEAELIQEKAKIAVADEVAELRKVADQRQEMQRRADALQARVAVHESNIDAYLRAVSSVALPLKEVVQKADGLVELERSVFGSGEGYHDQRQFQSAVNDIPRGYLPENFSCSFLEMEGGQLPAENQGVRAVALLRQAYALLAGLKKQPVSFPQREHDEGL